MPGYSDGPRIEPSRPTWVPGWLTQVVLLALAIAALVIGNADMAAIYLTGCAVIGAMRQIEFDRRR